MRDSKGRFVKGHSVPKEWKESYSEKNRLYRHTEEAKRKIKFHSKGARNPTWKGGKASYHRRIASKIMGL